MKKANIFIDMDGVIAEYDKNVVEHMYKKGFFENRPVVETMVELSKKLVKDYEVYILTSCIDSEYCQQEKASWLDKHLPEVKRENRVYVNYGEVKARVAEMTVDCEGRVNLLIDDYTENLDKWDLFGALPVKVMNGLNGTKGTWLNSYGSRINFDSSPEVNLRIIKSLIKMKEKSIFKSLA